MADQYLIHLIYENKWYKDMKFDDLESAMSEYNRQLETHLDSISRIEVVRRSWHNADGKDELIVRAIL